jgi:glycerate kinase
LDNSFITISGKLSVTMNILIAPDSFKDCMSAREVALNIEAGIKRVMPAANIKLLPMADGGEGTVEALVEARGGEIINAIVHDPLMRRINSFFGVLGDKKTAVIEMAAASGIELLKENERNPWITSTYGTGELISHALDMNCKKLVIGVGGSATNDAGTGMAQALGVRFLDNAGRDVAGSGGNLNRIADIDMSGLDKRISKCKILVACDVDNPFYGPRGAALTYAPQKGADKEMAKKLDANMRYFADKISEILGINIQNIKSAGAAGGLAGGLITFLKAELKPGFEVVKDIIKLESEIRKADIVITGEGKMDYQTQFGKVPFGVARIAASLKKPVIAIAGSLGDNAGKLYENIFKCIVPLAPNPSDIQNAIKNADKLIRDTAERIFGQINPAGKKNLPDF